ncbi:solute carrier family 12 member 2-like [Tachypleus tridentatus]|uniref:solute carrier family 12 member 2-like n=1 Tax=Tachypleus tridentatus TaxID=6853 RepID=UPI003FCEEBAE
MEGKSQDGSKQSRFQVDKVDFSSEKPVLHSEISLESKLELGLNTSNGRGSSTNHSVSLSGNSNTYENTQNVRSLRHYTREVLPNVDFYRNVMSLHGYLHRPTLDELHQATHQHQQQTGGNKNHKSLKREVVTTDTIKFGWIQGVFIRCLLNIWGVMLFIRLSWVVGQAGIGLACVVILLSMVVTVLTTISMSAICTNGEVKGGGSYYMISRSLGPEFGGAIGLIFSLASAVAVAMYVVGFGETLRDLLQSYQLIIIDGEMNDVRIIGSVTVVVLLGITMIGTQWESKAQIFLLVILLIAMGNFLIGCLLSPNITQQARGFVGWDVALIKENLRPNFRGEDFFSVFSVFFPAATGILAGANISGDLADPQRAIPKGTFLAIFISCTMYILFAIISGCVCLRDANGVELFVANGTIEMIQNCSYGPEGKCHFGLMNFYQVMELISAFGPLTYAGIFAATLSSALASLVSAPKVFQALCKDKLFPKFEFFAKGYGNNQEPFRAYILAFVIALACVIIGDLNIIAPIISNFFLAAYCLINFSCFHSTYSMSPGFRPAFKYYNMWISLLGAIICLAVMFVINWWTALMTYGIVLALYIFISHRKLDVNWGSSTQAQTYKDALTSVLNLNQIQEHVKNYRPQILVLTGKPTSRPSLIDFVYSITKKLSLMICGDVHKERLNQRERDHLNREAHQYLQKRKVKAFYSLIEESSFSRGVRSLIQLVGIGKLRPNMIFMGYKSDWQECEEQDVLEYFNVIHDAFDMHMSLGILRLRAGFDYSEYDIAEENENTVEREPDLQREESFLNFPRNISSAQLSAMKPTASWLMMFAAFSGGAPTSHLATPVSTPVLPHFTSAEPEKEQNNNAEAQKSSKILKGMLKDVPKNILSNVNQFQHKQKKGRIDVWWLYDDGGLTMLIPYLLTTRSLWCNCELRVFSLANKKDELDREQRNMAALLSKFRIDYSNVIVIPDVIKPPKESSKQEFHVLISKWRTSDESDRDPLLSVSDSEFLALKDKTRRHIRLRELLLQHSHSSSLIVMTLPMPRKGTCSAPMYMAWLETLTRNMPPFLLIRGNQTSVLTFYS